MTTKQDVNKAFRLLRKAGYFAKQNYWCCMSCGFAAAGEKDKIVFYHGQDNEAWDRKTKTLKNTLHLCWDGNSAEIVNILESVGLNVVWNGDSGKRIGILP